MKIQNNTIDTRLSTKKNIQNDNNPVSRPNSPAFKSAVGVLGFSGNIMQGIENQGFWLSFLIQDCLGMTVPRAIAGFLRDKEVTGQYNTKEGFEVLGREALTGPSMMAVAPIGLAIASAFGKSTSVNSSLIRRFGNNLSAMLSESNFDKSLLDNGEKFKTEFYRQNLSKMLSDTLGKENVTKKNVDYILEQLGRYENIPNDEKLGFFMGKSRYRSARMSDITKYIDNIRYKTSTNLDKLQALKVNDKFYSISEALEAMIKYSNDAISLNKNLKNMDSAMAENIKNAAVAKRFLTTVSLIASTLGVLAILPKIYASNSVPPGAQSAKLMEEQNSETSKVAESVETESKEASIESEKTSEAQENVSFKGGPSSKKGVLSAFGELLSKIFGDKFASELEYKGNNFTPSLMAGLSIFGLIGPRGLHAFKRAPKDENGKKDFTEIWEILIRDVTSSLAVVFLVPMLTRAFVTSYEKGTGFVLMDKDRQKSSFKTILDLFNPYSKAKVLSNSELNSLYNEVDSAGKMLNFCEYINKNGGDLQKILSISDGSKEFFANASLEADKLKQLDKAGKNKAITDYVRKLVKGNNTTEADNIIKKLMKSVKANSCNKISAIARGLNSAPGLIVMIFASPAVLGWFIPRLTYANTRRIHKSKQQEQDKAKQINTAV